jgi:putative ABC transport system substrate-binding protein
MQRRDFIMLLGGVAAWPLAARAQEAGRTYRLGSVHPNPRATPHLVAFIDELRRLGFIEGQNLTVDGRGFGLHTDQFSEMATEMVKAGVDVILCAGDAATRATQQATTTIPILTVTDDMVGSGLVRALAEPGNNTTGVSILAVELDGKRQEILIEAVPGLRRMAALADANQPRRREWESAAHARGIGLLIQTVSKSEQIAPAIDAAKAWGAAALNVLASPLFLLIARLYTNVPPRFICLRYTSFRKWRRRAASLGMARASFRSIETWCLDRPPSSSLGPSRPIYRLNSRQNSS